MLAFIEYLNSCDPNIQFTHEISQESISFLDTKISIHANKIKTDLFCKPTDSKNYLHYSSAHPNKCKDSIPYSQYLRIRRICSELEDFDKHMKEMTINFLKRGYPIDLLQEAALKARRANRQDLLTPNTLTQKSKTDRSILVTTFHPEDNSLRNIVSKNWDILGKNHSTLPVYNRKPMLAYRRPPNLKNLLVRADCRLKKESTITKGVQPNPFLLPKSEAQAHSKFVKTKQTLMTQFLSKNPAPLSITSSTSATCITTPSNPTPQRSSSLTNFVSNKSKRICTNHKCQFCPLLQKTSRLTCTITQRKYPSMVNISCKSSNLIYCITCQTCQKQYVGQTKNKIAQRFSSHFFNIRHKKVTDAVGLHFSQPDHNGIKDLTINVLEFIRLPPETQRSLEIRLRREKFWIHQLIKLELILPFMSLKELTFHHHIKICYPSWNEGRMCPLK